MLPAREIPVRVVRRVTKNGRRRYAIRWRCPETSRDRCRTIGADRKLAERARADLARQLSDGTYSVIRRIEWNEFLEQHVSTLPGARNRREARQCLLEFGRVCRPRYVTSVRFQMLEQFSAYLLSETDDRKPNSVATANKKFRYLKAALRRAVDRGLIKSSPMKQWTFYREHQEIKPIATREDLAAMEAAGERLYGLQFKALVVLLSEVGSRISETLALRWAEDIDLTSKRKAATFRETKGKKDRRVDLEGRSVSLLRRLRDESDAAGPFTSLGGTLHRKWPRMLQEAGVTRRITPHRLRATFVTNALQDSVPAQTVALIVGHEDVRTTLKHYSVTTERDRRDAMRRIHRKHA